MPEFAMAQQYHPIQVGTLQAGRVPPMDLFLQRDGEDTPILFLSRTLPYDRRVSKNLSSNSVQELLIRKDDKKAYDRYLQQNLASIIRDPSVPIHSRCSLTYDLSVDLMKKVFDSADPGAIIRSSQGVLNNMIEVIFADSKAAHSFITLTSKDYYTYTHSVNVCLYGMALARSSLAITKEEALSRFGPGLLLHDIGKLQIPNEILNKSGPLTEEEMELIKQHTRMGLETVESLVELSEETRSMILDHHERLDGSGYPEGLRGSEISIPARICAIADTFDAISTNRSFQERKQSFDAFNTIKQTEIPHRLDESFFQEFVRLFIPTP